MKARYDSTEMLQGRNTWGSVRNIGRSIRNEPCGIVVNIPTPSPEENAVVKVQLRQLRQVSPTPIAAVVRLDRQASSTLAPTPIQSEIVSKATTRE